MHTKTTPPEGESPYILDRMHASHIMWEVCKEDKDPLWFCNRCGAYSFKRCKRLTEACSGALKEKSSPWFRLQELRKGIYPNTKVFWAKPTPALRSFRGHAEELVKAPVQLVSDLPPFAPPLSPSSLRVSLEDDEFWWDATNRPEEIEERDFAFDLDFFGPDVV